MEDFREIVGFLIIGIGILMSVLKERKGNKKSDSSAPAQNTPIQRRPNRPEPAQGTAPGPRLREQAPPQVAAALPFVVTSVANKARQQQQANQSTKPCQPLAPETSAYEFLPEEGMRVTQDLPPMEPVSDYSSAEEEALIEKLREGIILSEILKRKF